METKKKYRTKYKKNANANHYVDNVAFYNAIKELIEKRKEAEKLGLEKPKITNYIGDCIQKIAHHLSFCPNFIGYSFREDMVSDAILNSIKYFDNFDPDNWKNPHAYFTFIAFNAFIRRIEEEKEEQYIKYKSMERKSHQLHELGEDDFEVLDEDFKKRVLSGSEIYDNMSKFISEFEEKKKEKKRKLKEAKLLKNNLKLEIPIEN